MKYEKFQWALQGVKPIVVGMIAAVVVNLVFKNIFGGLFAFSYFDYIALSIMVIIVVLRWRFKKLNPIYLIIISGLLGMLAYTFFPI